MTRETCRSKILQNIEIIKDKKWTNGHFEHKIAFFSHCCSKRLFIQIFEKYFPLNLLDIDTSGQEVGGDQDSGGAGPKLPHSGVNILQIIKDLGLTIFISFKRKFSTHILTKYSPLRAG